MDKQSKQQFPVGKYLFKVSKITLEQRSIERCSNVILMNLNRYLPTGVILRDVGCATNRSVLGQLKHTSRLFDYYTIQLYLVMAFVNCLGVCKLFCAGVNKHKRCFRFCLYSAVL